MNVVACEFAMSRGQDVSADTEESRLIAACKEGDPEAFEDLVRRHERRVFRLVSRFYRQPDMIEELAQETFVTAWTKLHTYRAEAPFEHWLTRVCLNCCYARLRKQKPSEELIGERLEAPASDPDARLEIESLLRELKPDDRFLLQLLYGEGWTIVEIADRMGWSGSKVKVRAHRARRKLRSILETS